LGEFLRQRLQSLLEEEGGAATATSVEVEGEETTAGTLVGRRIGPPSPDPIHPRRASADPGEVPGTPVEV
ncbi:MAG: hypothetical protein ACO4CW_06935, partial [Planctomycetota bacterium]